MSNADRYLIIGAALTAIYPGDLTGLNQALKDCVQTSRRYTDLTIKIFAVYGEERSLMRIFRGGDTVWAESNDSWEGLC